MARSSKTGRAADTEPAAALFKALADTHRLRILAMIAQVDECCVCDLNDCVPLLQPTVSHHLKVLRDSGLVIGKRRGNWVYYRLAADAADRVRGAFAHVLPRGVSHENSSLAADRQTRRKRRVLPHAARRRAAQATR